jgi:hypothetical protein
MSKFSYKRIFKKIGRQRNQANGKRRSHKSAEGVQELKYFFALENQRGFKNGIPQMGRNNPKKETPSNVIQSVKSGFALWTPFYCSM